MGNDLSKEIMKQMELLTDVQRKAYQAGYEQGRKDEKKEQEQRILQMEADSISNLEK